MTSKPTYSQFEPDYKLDTSYATGNIIKHDDNGTVQEGIEHQILA